MIVSKDKNTMTEWVEVGFEDLLAVVGEIDTEVHEVIFSPTRLVNDALQHRLVHFVGNVA